MNEITKIFNYEDNLLRTVIRDSGVWFIAKDIAEILGYQTLQKLYSHIDTDDKMMINPQIKEYQGLCQNKNTYKLLLINESGLYSAIFGSKLPKAKEFRRWVTNEVIPSIRKHGAYMTNEVIEKTLLDPKYIIGIITKLEERGEEIIRLETKIDRDVPKLKAYDSLLAQKNNMSMLYASKLLNICGRNTLFKVLRDEKVFLEGRVVPYQSYIREGYFKVVCSHKIVQGESIGFPVTLITPKGLVWLRKRLESYYSNGYILKYTEMGVVK